MGQSFVYRIPWRALGAAWLVLITGNWAAQGLEGDPLFDKWHPALEAYQVPITVLIVALFIITSVWLYRNRQAFALARNLSRRLCEPHASVILLVSTPTPTIVPPSAVPLFPLRVTDKGQTVELQGQSLEKDIQTLNAIRWNWQQLLRAIAPHRRKLRRLRLIGSPGSGGSFNHLPLCKNILTHYLPEVKIIAIEEPTDFEDFNALVRCMKKIIDQEKDAGMKEQDIVIDVTGGIKTASIAGASITFNSSVTFQYVQTFPPNDVYAYDVMYQPLSSEE